LKKPSLRLAIEINKRVREKDRIGQPLFNLHNQGFELGEKILRCVGREVQL
jgi:hypothetical protein